MDKQTAIATLDKLGGDNPGLKKFTDKIIQELEAPNQVNELEKIKVLFRSGSSGELLTNSLILAVKQDNIKVELVEPVKPEVEDVVKENAEEVIEESVETVEPKVEKPLPFVKDVEAPIKINDIK